MNMVVRAYPVLPGKEQAVRDFAKRLAGQRHSETSAFLGSYSIRHESWHLQETPHGAIVIVVSQLTDAPELQAQKYASCDRGFDCWFKDQVRSLTGVDPGKEPLGPQTEPIFTWANGELS